MLKHILKPTFLLLLTMVAIVLFNLGGRPLSNPDEGRYVEIPREMVESGNYVTPRLNGLKYFEKPPLFYWLQALHIKLFDINETSMRLWVAILSMLTVAGVYIFTRHFESEKAAFFASSTLLLSGLFYALSRVIILDMPLTCFVTLGLLSFFYAFHHDGGRRRIFMYVFSIFMALGILTKGIVILALAGPIIFIWLTYTREWQNLRPFYPISCLVIMAAIAAPWHILASHENPDFLHKYFYVEHWLRYTTKMHMRYQPMWYFIPILILGFLPWTFNFFHKKHYERESFDPYRLKSFCWIWFLWVLGFFSISNSKLIPYILPAFPAIAILMGRFFYDVYHDAIDIKPTRFIAGGLYLALGCVAFLLPSAAQNLFKDASQIIPYVYSLGAIFIIGGCFMMMAAPNRVYIFSQYVVGIAILVLINLGAEYIQKTSAKPIAQYILEHDSSRRVVSYKTYLQDLPVYTKQRVIVADATGELEFGMLAEDSSAWMINTQKLLHRMKSEKFWIVGKRGEIDALKILSKKKSTLVEVFSHKELVLLKNN
jgi:4-amino-4-deoxy-L-arabinose transferase-like glycosyltransferase